MIIATAFAAMLMAVQSAEAPPRPVPAPIGAEAGKALAEVISLINEGEYAKALTTLDALLADELSPSERAAALEIRGVVKASAEIGDARGALADLETALDLDVLPPDRVGEVASRATSLALTLGEDERAVRLLSLVPERQHPSVYYEAGRLDLAAEALADRPQTGDSEAGLYRYLLALRGANADAAAAALEALAVTVAELDLIAETVSRERASMAVLFAGEPTPDARAARAAAFLADYRAAWLALRPIQSVVRLPSDRCLDRQAGGGTVALRFDIDERGRTRNVRVVHSDDDCLDKAAVRTIKARRYVPLRRGGVATGRKDVRANVRYARGDG